MVSRRAFIGLIVSIAIPACATTPTNNSAPQWATAKLAITGMT